MVESRETAETVETVVGAGDDKLDRSVWLTAGVVVLGAIMSILDVTVVNIALETFMRQFHISSAVAAWTMTGYTLALAAVIPVTGWAADRFGTKRLYILALTLFILGSVLCATAWNIGSLIAFRVLQGLGGGMLMPLGMTIMTRAAGPHRVGRVMAVLGVPMLLGPILGPILGGWLIQSYSWHWIFLINVPIGILALIAAVALLPRDVGHAAERFDWIGMLLLSPGLALFLFGVSSIPETHTVWSARVLIPALIGIALIAAFVFHALRSSNPLIDLHLFRNRNITIASITMTVFAVAFFGSALLFPLYFQQIRGQGTLDTGLLLIPQGVGAMLTMPVAGRMVDRIGPGKIVLTGLALIILGLLVFPFVGPDTSYVRLLGGLFVMGMGMGCTMMPVMTAALATLRDKQIARGSTLMNIVNQVGSSIGSATTSVLLTHNVQAAGKAAQTATTYKFLPPEAKAAIPAQYLQQGYHDAARAFGHTFIMSVVLVAVCLIPAAFLPRTRQQEFSSAETGEPPVVMH
ncbi:MAG: DHA2 family efflux MFS transporter permease subunit [Mycobacteriaceae bacterium]|nr:DHA2 family efflux MFS transporter permease subunit [Mycobacteriaceae bacterium]